MNKNKICFIACVNNSLFWDECVRYLHRLYVPDGFEVEALTITDAASMAAGYNEGMIASDAKYKIYLHQDVFLTDRYFLYELIDIFKSDDSIGMVGAVGTIKMSKDGVMWHGDRVSCMYSKFADEIDQCEVYYGLEDLHLTKVEAIDGLLMATQYDVGWREDLFKNFDFYDASQSMEFRKKGYTIVVPKIKKPVCVHDDGVILNLENYNDNRIIFLKEYKV